MMKKSKLSTRSRTGIRPEIQGLRAVAVTAVVLYHLWPTRLPGGYVGVDIFFAISGFLIIGHLLREVDRRGRVSLISFWARRARRLLPASLLVLTLTGAAVIAFVPPVAWKQFFQEIGASALYVQNWLLAANAVDYLGAENAASPAQHFWSLSVEEQFYIAWPIVIVAILWLSRRLRRQNSRRWIGAALIVLTAASFAYSVLGVATDPSAAYFVTTGRAWEFGIGGILAYFAAKPVEGLDRMRGLVAWAGIGMIAVTLFSYTSTTPFPGVAALLPVVGTILVIWAGDSLSWWSPAAVFRPAPVQWLGDVSYSLYLWHWPLIVILPFVSGHPLGWRSRVGILVLSVVLAWLTKVLLEDPVRNSRVLISRPAWLSIVSMLSATVVVVAGCGFVYAHTEQSILDAKLAALRAIAQPCVGALATASGSVCKNPYRVDGLTDPTFAASDIGKGVEISDQCKQMLDLAALKPCSIGDLDRPAMTLALIGDSHAGQYLEALDVYGQLHHMKFVTYLKSWCAGSGADDVSSVGYGTPTAINSCAQWGKNVLARVASDKHISGAIFSSYVEAYSAPSSSGRGRPLAASDFETAWHTLTDVGKKVIVLRDLPNGDGVSDPACVAQHLKDYDPCPTPRADAMLALDHDPAMIAASQMSSVKVIDLSDVLCDSTNCHSVIGGLIVRFDSNHMTATFSRSLAPVVGEQVRKAMSSKPSLKEF